MSLMNRVFGRGHDQSVSKSRERLLGRLRAVGLTKHILPFC